MRATYRTLNNRLSIELPESEGVRGLYKSIAAIDEVFNSVTECGACHGTEIQLRVRSVNKDLYFEAQCQTQGCRAKLEFGQHKDGDSLYPKRKDKEGNWLPNRGWTIWKGTAAAAGSETDTPF